MKLNKKKMILGISLTALTVSPTMFISSKCDDNKQKNPQVPNVPNTPNTPNQPLQGPIDPKSNFSEELKKVTLKVDNVAETFANNLTKDDVTPEGFDENKFKCVVTKLEVLSDKMSVKVFYKLIEIATNKESTETWKTLTGFKQVTQNPTNLDEVLKGIKADVGDKSEKYAESFNGVKADEFVFKLNGQDLDYEKYEIVDFKSELRSDNVSLKVTYAVKDIASGNKSKAKTEVVTGFKKKVTATSEDINKELQKTKVDVEDKENKKASGITPDLLEFSGFNETVYSIDEENVEIKVNADGTSIDVTFQLVANEDENIKSNKKTVTISGFKKSTGNEEQEFKDKLTQIVADLADKESTKVDDVTDEFIKGNLDLTMKDGKDLEDYNLTYEYVSFKKKDNKTIIITLKIQDSVEGLEGTIDCEVSGFQA